MKNKEYYLFKDILYKMRELYLENKQILKKLSENINVESDEDINYHLDIFLKNYNDDTRNYPRLELRVARNKKEDNVIIKNFKNLYYGMFYIYNTDKWAKDNAWFAYDDVSGDFFSCVADIPNSLKVNVEITNKEEFLKEYEKLKKDILFNLPRMYTKINIYQSLLIESWLCKLESTGVNVKGIDIAYNSIDDTIKINSDIVYSKYFINDLLNTKIPRYELLDEYKNLFDNEIDFIINDDVSEKKEKLEIVENDKKLILRRK